MPLGGAVATALNWRMVRGWGHSDGAFVGLLPAHQRPRRADQAAAARWSRWPGLAAGRCTCPAALWWRARPRCGTSLLAAVLPPVLLATDAAARGRRAPGPCDGSRLRSRRPHGTPSERIRAPAADAVAHGWSPAASRTSPPRCCCSTSACTRSGSRPPLVVVLMAAAIERLGTLVPITPGGTGIAEIGTIAWLVGHRARPGAGGGRGAALPGVPDRHGDPASAALLLGGWAWSSADRARTRTATRAAT